MDACVWEFDVRWTKNRRLALQGQTKHSYSGKPTALASHRTIEQKRMDKITAKSKNVVHAMNNAKPVLASAPCTSRN